MPGDISKSRDIQQAIANADLVFDLAAPGRGFINEIKCEGRVDSLEKNIEKNSLGP